MNKFFIGVLFILFTTHIISAQQGTQKFKQHFLTIPKLYDDYIYGFNKETALLGKRIGKSPLLFKTDNIESMDIDIEEDWDACVSQYKRIKSNAKF